MRTIYALMLACSLGWSAAAAAQQPLRLELSNGNGTPGVTDEVLQWLADPGYSIARVSEAPTQRYGQTFILYRPGMRGAAESLAEKLPVKEVLRQTGVLAEDIDIRLLLGRDVAHRIAQPPPPGELDGRARIEVSNGNGVRGMAARMQAFLSDRGGRVVSIDNADRYDYERSILYYRPGSRAAAQALAAALPVLTVQLEQSEALAEGVDLRLVVGRDFISYDLNRLQPQYAAASD